MGNSENTKETYRSMCTKVSIFNPTLCCRHGYGIYGVIGFYKASGKHKNLQCCKQCSECMTSTELDILYYMVWKTIPQGVFIHCYIDWNVHETIVRVKINLVQNCQYFFVHTYWFVTTELLLHKAYSELKPMLTGRD